MSAIVFADRGREGAGHWYDRSGRLIESVPDAKGNPRKPTLRDARKHGWLPGVTTIIRAAAAPGLEKWKQQQSIMAALTLPRGVDEPEDDWMDRVIEDSAETARKAAEAGTRIHASIAQHFTDGVQDDNWDHVRGVVTMLERVCGQQAWVGERAVVSPRGYATMADALCADFLIDFKTKEGDEAALRRMPTWDTHHMQLAATREAISGAHRCAIVYVSRTHPGVCHMVEVMEPDLQRGLRMFHSLLAYWQESNDFFPGWNA